MSDQGLLGQNSHSRPVTVESGLATIFDDDLKSIPSWHNEVYEMTSIQEIPEIPPPAADSNDALVQEGAVNHGYMPDDKETTDSSSSETSREGSPVPSGAVRQNSNNSNEFYRLCIGIGFNRQCGYSVIGVTVLLFVAIIAYLALTDTIPVKMSPYMGDPDAEEFILEKTTSMSPTFSKLTNKSHSIVIDTPTTLPELPLSTMELILMPQEKYNWTSWNIPNLEVVESLVLSGPFDAADIKTLVLAIPNLVSLNISLGKKVCSLVQPPEIADEKLSQHLHLQTLIISGMETCDNLFNFLSKTLQFTSLESITLESVPVMFENLNHIDQLFRMHHETLKHIHLTNVILCQQCILFDKMHFRWMDEAMFTFLRPHYTPAMKSLENFQAGTSRLTKFVSNVHCSEEEREKMLDYNWANIEVPYRSMICDTSRRRNNI